MFIKGKQYFLQGEYPLQMKNSLIHILLFQVFLLYVENFNDMLIHYGDDRYFRNESNTSVVKSSSALDHWLALSIFPLTKEMASHHWD